MARRSSAFLTRRPIPSAEVRCEGCALWHRVERTRHVATIADGVRYVHVLCLDCADRVEAQEQARDDERSRLASYYHP
jgi:hypothetical protein